MPNPVEAVGFGVGAECVLCEFPPELLPSELSSSELSPPVLSPPELSPPELSPPAESLPDELADEDDDEDDDTTWAGVGEGWYESAVTDGELAAS